MRRLMFLGLFMVVVAGSIFAQPVSKDELSLRNVELLSPWDDSSGKTVWVSSRHHQNCLDLLRLLRRCNRGELLHYGNRSGVNWDVFSVSGGRDSQSRMIDLGEHNWNDRFTIPEIEPWPALKEGETRTITVNTSGARGKDGESGKPGEPGSSADGTVTLEVLRTGQTPAPTRTVKRKERTIDYGKASLSLQISSTINVRGKAPVTSGYNPFTEAKKGHMYLIRVINSEIDDYVLLRVDDLVRGEKVSISYFRFPAAL